LRKWFLPSDIRNCIIVNTSNVLTANYAALQVCLGTLKAGIEMETLRKQGTPEKLLATQYEPFKTTFIKHNRALTTCISFGRVLAAVLQQVLLLGLALAFASEFENGSFKN
jgi:ABC-2 type transport system permease protein